MEGLARGAAVILVFRIRCVFSGGLIHRDGLLAVKQTNIAWADIESMLTYLGAEITEGRGSRVRVALNGVRAVFHRPHPEKETDRGAVASVRRFLSEAGIESGEEK